LKEYKTVFLNPGIKLSREKDLATVDATLNKMVEEGWTLEHIISPNDFGGAMVGIFSKEK
jgi:hypothetical protein